MATNAQGAASRAAAAQTLFAVLEKGQSLSEALPHYSQSLPARDQSLVQAMCYGVLRDLPSLNEAINQRLEKPLKGTLKPLHYLLLVGAYQLISMRTKAHAAVSATVEACVTLKKGKQKGLVNGVLRNLQRALDNAPLAERDDANHPRWLLEKIQAAYPQQWRQITAENNQQAPMWLRIDERQQSAAEYLQQLQQNGIKAELDPQLACAIKLQHPAQVTDLPGYADGLVSVQDRAAQFAAIHLDSQTNDRVLDCCAAPGGKTVHIGEHSRPQQPILAIDVETKRLQRVKDNIARSNINAEVVCADVREREKWWDGTPFQRILLDAPCSATGVIRRHPDIKWLRRASDIAALVALQAEILDSLWPTLAPGGTLLYATCSILPEENDQQIQQFLARTKDAKLIPLQADMATIQWLPGQHAGDGFYYAKLEKAL
ncbi:16S rRNA (cytosine(967)-C(5))-methyltransferase RsmB [Idiomarina tyrosinivorans]|uniref:16S rRNA (cytosine(967)-C(5))-methyltransferase n=1 Tax=Idiomarina tyrosinivorans TaxID=1445662 RepID=A0A432ZT60_9GAMM|nr:16S rRNA (cytosine(967)-C(5))-methyltransferase RsmB [Idiomarina tyrosinivorans]RUO81042.1 16S rRNA (cytosine(967)-C(5))-methyltransferase RsmB [Idiomarina tyrosinivorans]